MDIKPEPNMIEACPFCKGRCVDIAPLPGSTTIFYPYVQCLVCGYTAPGRGTISEAIAAHNALARMVLEAVALDAARRAALEFSQDGQMIGERVKAWAIDQMVRALTITPEAYQRFVDNWNNAPPQSWKWDAGDRS